MSEISSLEISDGAAVEQPSKPPQASNGITYVVDSTGRRIGLRKLKPSERYALSEAVEAATMSANLQLITAATVFSIGEDGMTPIKNRADLLRRLDDIGDEGLQAITPVALKFYGIDLDKAGIEAAKN